MSTILLIIHLLIAVALVTIVLMQKSEGGALGMGGGGAGGGSFLSGRGTANLLTKSTAFLAMLFFCTSIGLAILSGGGGTPRSVLDDVPAGTSGPAQPGSGGILDDLQGGRGLQRLPSSPSAPSGN
ncbi:MAG: preprotein translocase subunit SecG [Pseudomonadota bacterium]